MDGRGVRHPVARRRRRTERALIAAAAAALALIPVVAPAAASPKPSLEGILAAPPSADFVEDTESTGTPIGQFDEAAYLDFLGAKDPPEAQKALHDDGFVAGYGRSWTSRSTGAGLVELVVAFAGGRGAEHWLEAAERYAKDSDFYKGPITVAGIAPAFGVRYADPTGPSFAQVVSFVKGNDYFLVGFVSGTDEPGDSVVAQSKVAYRFAPAQSIRPQDWPENARPPLSPVVLLVAGLALAAAAGLAVAVLLVVAARRRGPPAPLS